MLRKATRNKQSKKNNRKINRMALQLTAKNIQLREAGAYLNEIFTELQLFLLGPI